MSDNMLDFILGISEVPNNLSKVSEITDFGGWLTFTNDLSQGSFGYLTVVSIFIIVYVSIAQRGTSTAFITAAFAGFMSSLLLAMMSIVDGAVVVIMLVMMAVGAAWGITKKG